MVAGTQDSFCTICNKDTAGEPIGLRLLSLLFVLRVPTTGGSLSISLVQTRTPSKMGPQACFWDSLDGLKTSINHQLPIVLQISLPGFTQEPKCALFISTF